MGGLFSDSRLFGAVYFRASNNCVINFLARTRDTFTRVFTLEGKQSRQTEVQGEECTQILNDLVQEFFIPVSHELRHSTGREIKDYTDS